MVGVSQRVEIRGNLRFGGWFQTWPGEFDSPDLDAHILRMALADWVRFQGRRSVEIVVTERTSQRSRGIVMPPFEEITRLSSGWLGSPVEPGHTPPDAR